MVKGQAGEPHVVGAHPEVPGRCEGAPEEIPVGEHERARRSLGPGRETDRGRRVEAALEAGRLRLPRARGGGRRRGSLGRGGQSEIDLRPLAERDALRLGRLPADQDG